MQAKAQPNRVVQAVDVWLQLECRVVRAIVARSVFESCFGATENPSSWMEAYENNKDCVAAAIRRKAAQFPEAGTLILQERDFEGLTAERTLRSERT